MQEIPSFEIAVFKMDLQDIQSTSTGSDFTSYFKKGDPCTLASYDVSYIIAKKGRPFSDGEYIKSAIMAVNSRLNSAVANLSNNISLSASLLPIELENWRKI